ncbi:MAG: response regulator [bacterium]|nr:response regulator [bacterium]
MEKPRVLWVDDEIDLLRSQVQFLEGRGYEVVTVVNGTDAVELVRQSAFDVVLLDEIMVGMDGLSTLKEIKAYDPALPVIMVTKSTEETLMDEAYFGEIADFLVKPVNPHQILSSLKKILDLEKLRRDKFVSDFGNYYNEAQAVINGADCSFEEWADLYGSMCRASIEIDAFNLDSMRQLQRELDRDADEVFSRFVADSYPSWLKGQNDPPVISHRLLDEYVFPHIDGKKHVYLVVIDCLRLDQWMVIEQYLNDRFRVERDTYCALIPSATLYSRNAIFSGMLPKRIYEKYPEQFSESNITGESLNKNEEQFLNDNLRSNFPDIKECRFFKMAGISDARSTEKLLQSIPRRSLTAYVFNFIDAITHESGKPGVLDMLAPTASGLRRLALSWFNSSPLNRLLSKLSEDPDAVIVITSDHGSRITATPTIVYASKDATKSPRYWFGRDLRDEGEGAFLIRNPEHYGLPDDILSKTYVLAQSDHHLVFSRYINKFDKKFTGGFFHGGVSMAELIVPVATLTPK